MTMFDGVRVKASRGLLAALTAAGLLVGTGIARADDAEVKRKVEERLAKAKVYQAADVRVTVANGQVALDGVASRMDAALAAERAARKVSKSVVSRISVIPDERRKDSEIRADVADAVLGYSLYTVFDSIEAGVEDGVVTLRGSVNQPYRKTDIEDRVARVAGVRGLVSQIEVQGVSGFDDQLRRQLVRRIYGSDDFRPYAHWAHPPIRIVVDKGKVTLTGYVSSRVEQQLLGHIARGTLAFGVDNRVKVESERNQEAERRPVKS